MPRLMMVVPTSTSRNQRLIPMPGVSQRMIDWTARLIRFFKQGGWLHTTAIIAVFSYRVNIYIFHEKMFGLF